MKEAVIILLVFVLMGVGSCAEGSWGEIGDGDDLEDDKVLESEDVSGEVLTSQESVQSSGDGEEWTRDFYIALGIGGLGLLIVGIFIYLFMRSPKNKWKK